MNPIAVIGAGAAGLLAAITAAERGAPVLLIERNARPGRKLMITGKGRCNVTNACTREEFLPHVVSDPRFLYSALTSFPTERTMRFFEELGVPLKVERGRRVFPVSDRAVDIVDALAHRVRALGVCTVCDRATDLRVEEGRVTAVIGEQGVYPCAACVICTGGLSYPATGSTGDGYALAERVGHTLTPRFPSLVPLEVRDPFCRDCMGLSLRNAGLTLYREDKEIYRDFGELLFTHFGLSGPVILSASCRMRKPGRYRVELDLKPALSDDQLDARLLREIAEAPRRELRGLLRALLPQKMVDPFREKCGIPAEKRSAELSRAERERIRTLLRRLSFEIAGRRPYEEAVVTAGGVSIREVDPRTMASRRVSGLYFAGEVLDADAETGGYNLQIAFATGHAAGLAAAEKICEAST